MNKYNPKIHHRRSIRLKGYDYTQEGLYFITICCQDRACLFGRFENMQMQCNDAGQMIEKWYRALETKFPDIKCHEMIVMPNHIHFIIENVGAVVGADPRVCPIDDSNLNSPIIPGEIVRADPRVCPNDESIDDSTIIPGEIVRADPRVCPNDETIDDMGEHVGSPLRVCHNDESFNHPTGIQGEHVGSPLHRVVQWFKTMTTNEYIRGVKNLGWAPFNGKLWQRNYYEHIIRDDLSYQRISDYIRNNPAQWDNDALYSKQP
jgi:putative transposase